MSALSPPHDIDAESSVLGSVLLAPAWLTPVAAEIGLKRNDFYRERHRLIWDAIMARYDAGEPVDTLTVTANLRRSHLLEEVGGEVYVESLVEKIPSIANAKQYAQIVKDNAILRELLAASQEIQASIATREGDVRSIVAAAQQRLSEVGTTERSTLFTPDDMDELAVRQSGEPREAFPFPWPRMNVATNGGLRRGQMMTLAAWPNVSKSLAIDQIVEHMAGAERKACIYLTEMTVEERNARFIARHTPLTIDEVIKGNFNANQIRAMEGYSFPRGVHIQPAAGWTAQEICHDVMRRGWDIVAVDDIENLTYPGNEPKQEKKAEMTRLFATLTKENQANCALIVVSHLSRHGNKDEAPPRPREAHLRDTQMLAARADICCFFHRELDELGHKKPEVEWYFTRNRSGQLLAGYLYFRSEHMRLEPADLEDLRWAA